MNPYGLVWKLLPWALTCVMALALWGAYGYVKSSQREAEVAKQEAASLLVEKLELERRAQEHARLLVERENQRLLDMKTIARQNRAIAELKHEGCLSLDTPYRWLDDALGVLPNGDPLPNGDG